MMLNMSRNTVSQDRRAVAQLFKKSVPQCKPGGGVGEGTGSRAQDMGAPHPRMCFTSSYMPVLRQDLCARPGKVPELNTDRVICKLTKKKKKTPQM